MNEIKLKNWDEFESEYQKIYEKNLEKQKNTNSYISDILFRGQANSKWKLETTLERFTKKSFSIASYNILLKIVKNKIESFTNDTWSLVDYDLNNESFLTPPPNYEFMAYLRHHSFPSPLLDWTRSPYIAAYFAFNKADKINNDFISIYCFQEWLEEGKNHYGEEPSIVGIGPNLKTHKRHYIQQSEYTICKKPDRNDREKYIYCSHEDGFALKKDGQDILWRYLIPTTEKDRVLDKLDKMNINSYTLFETVEALMDVLARHEIE